MERRKLVTIILAMLASLSVMASFLYAEEEETAPYSLFQSPQAAFFIENTDEVLILDVRSETAYKRAHLENAVHIYLHDDDFIREVSRLDSSRPILVYDSLSPPTRWTFPVLRNAGFAQIIYMRDGFTGWRRNGLPVERGTTVETFDFSARGVNRGR